MRYICLACGHTYDETLGDPANGIAPGSLFAELPAEWQCDFCGAEKDAFTSEDEI